MSMSPENFIGLTKKCDDLLISIQNILNDKSDMPEIEAAEVYDNIIVLETELSIALKNIKGKSETIKYQSYLNEILSYKENIYLIAHIM